MSLLTIVLAIAIAVLVLMPLLYLVFRRMEQREPYGSFIRLRTRQKVRFFRLLMSDARVPKRVKVLPFLLVPYLAFPIDIIPDFIPVLGYMDDVAIVLGTFALAIRWTPRVVIDDLLRQLGEPA